MVSKPNVLLTRKLPERAIKLLKQHVALHIHEQENAISKGEMLHTMSKFNGLICMLSDTIDKEIIAAAGSLKIIANYAVGYNNIDITAATKKRIAVTNTPGVLTETTADLTFALILSLARRIPEADRFVREGNYHGWLPLLMLGSDIFGKTLGVIGFGRIGRAVACRAQGFDMKILYYEPDRLGPDIENKYRVEYRTLEELLREADYISIHVPLTDATHHLIGEQELNRMKRSAFLINVARGPVVDEEALVHALRERSIAGCALDVFEYEPAIEPELIAMSNVVIVPHIGSATVETREKMALMVVEDILDVLIRNKMPAHVINSEIYKE